MTSLKSNQNTILTFTMLALAVAFGAWGYSLGEPASSHTNLTEEVVVLGILGAIVLSLMVGLGIKGKPTALINLNRLLAWPMAFGYIFVHHAYHMEHGQAGGLMALDIVPRVFFLVSFVWIAFHAGVAYKTYGAPWKLKLKTMHDFYIASAWLVLLITIPVFSIPALGAMPIAMALAWLVFAPHLAINVFHMSKRVPVSSISEGVGPWIVSGIYLVAIVNSAIMSFPKS
jgi:hypothetical protein